MSLWLTPRLFVGLEGENRMTVLGEDAGDIYSVLSEDCHSISTKYPIKNDGVNHDIVLSEDSKTTASNT